MTQRWMARVVVLQGILLLMLAARPARAGDDWLPVSPEELSARSEPAAPGVHAIYLFREEHRDDVENFELHYNRIKILSEEGKKYGDIEIAYVKEVFQVRDIRARVIQPSGATTNFEGRPFDKPVVKGRGIKFLAKTLTLPDVQVGSIIEYKYKLAWDPGILLNNRWILNEELFTKRARFTMRPFRERGLRWVGIRVPQGKLAQERKGGLIHLELENIPALQQEEFMPPENEMKSRVDFFYTDSVETNPDKFWKEEGKRLYNRIEDFVGHRQGTARAVGETISPQDAPEVKLRKLYARAQSIRNLSFERSRTQQEEKREKLKGSENIEDLLKRGYGYGNEITWLFLGFVRAAGFEAYPVMVSRRDEYFFNRNLLDTRQLNDNVVLVKLDGQELYFDPGTLFCPFGLLPWPETGVQGLRLEKDGGVFLTTPLPPSSVSRVERRATLRVNEDFELEGTLSVTFTGLEAQRRRRAARDEDDADRRQSLEEEIKYWFPVGTTFELQNKPDWSGTEESLRAEYSLHVPHWANSTGRRILMPVSVLAGSKEHRFESATRNLPIYFDFPYETLDEVKLQLPKGFQAASVPQAQDRQTAFGHYQLACRVGGDTLHIQRQFSTRALLIPVQYYAGLRGFFENVRAADEEPVVLESSSLVRPQ